MTDMSLTGFGWQLRSHAVAGAVAAICLLTLAPTAVAQAPEVIGVSGKLAERHLLGSQVVRSAAVEHVEDIGMTIRVSPEGDVLSVRATPFHGGSPSPNPAAIAAAQSAARSVGFSPFTYRGRPITAEVHIDFVVRPAERWANRSAPFPKIDWDTLRITLTRSGCFFGCPAYEVEIDGTGRVVFSSEPANQTPPKSLGSRVGQVLHGVAMPGRHETQVSKAAVVTLVHAFQDAIFFGLADDYESAITDQPTVSLTVDTGNGKKRVLDYAGLWIGMPEAVRQLEEAVDRVAGTARWVRGGSGLVAWLDEQGFNFKSREAAAILLNAAQPADADTIVAMVDRGLPLDTPIKSGAGKPDTPLGLELLREAFHDGQLPVFRRLVADGWLKRLPPSEAGHLFAAWVGGCNPDFIDAAIASGIPANAQTIADPVWSIDAGGTALNRLDVARCKTDADRIETTRRLVAHGANPNHRDSRGQTALYWMEDPDLLELLLSSGADARIRDRDGAGPVLYSSQDTVVLRLLEAGASSLGQLEHGETLDNRLKDGTMPATARWLAAHGQATAPSVKP
ncbi:DUF6438 domain-containing protein [Nitrospirillum sp. BR 11828]|uniref:DUF6438 domain-containing protein n=1 Tax=Nitrospirillum sp. BR 11828 TaxID=3104325 RepID=UPI002ACA0C69|nr:DUF6438 domain-containing protein [Nitrospirillum sp. BR 11828]MDZ5647838.1 DUF6438 domain-containing protein [Nitrospirillum sp. BR 11828]